jgi:hypothetical protein
MQNFQDVFITGFQSGQLSISPQILSKLLQTALEFTADSSTDVVSGCSCNQCCEQRSIKKQSNCPVEPHSTTLARELAGIHRNLFALYLVIQPAWISSLFEGRFLSMPLILIPYDIIMV